MSRPIFGRDTSCDEAYFRDAFGSDKEYKEKIEKLLDAKESDLDIVLPLMTEKEKDSMIRWGISYITDLKKHDKNELFKLVYNYYKRSKKDEDNK